MDEKQAGESLTKQEQEQGSPAQQEQLRQALETLRRFVQRMAEQAGLSDEYAQGLWQRIQKSGGLLQELAYYHDYGDFLCKYQVAGYTLADILVWQVDHFKLYMDRPDEMNRYRQQRLLLSAFDTMLQMETDPLPFINKMENESGQDAANG